jgi:hypothetical protein
VLGFVAFCGWNVWAAFQPGHAWANRDMDDSALDDLRDRTSVMLTGLLAWGFLATVVVKGRLGSMKWSGWDSRSFNARVREQILRGVPIRSGALLGYALFVLVGLGLGLAQIRQELSLLPWLGSTPTTIQDRSLWASVMAVFAISSGARLLWQILIQAEWDYFVGNRRAEVAEEFLRVEEAQREEEWEEERTSVGGWSWAVLIVGIIGGMFLGSRLPEAEQNQCILSGFAGLVAAGIAVYVARTKPRGSAGWLGLVALLFAAALAYGWQAFDHPTARSLLLGVMGGATVGGMCVLLYLNRIRRYPRPAVQKHARNL